MGLLSMDQEFLFQSPSFAQCHAVTIAETPVGAAAAWFGGSREGAEDVAIWFIRKTGPNWSSPVEVAGGLEDGVLHPTWNPVLYQVPGGSLVLFYKVGPSPKTWWGRLTVSEDGGRTWSESKRLPDGILGPIKNKPILLDNGILLCPSSSEDQGWRVHVELTPDLGQSWRRIQIESDDPVIQPTILQYADGRLQLLCRSQCGWITSCWSVDGGESWSTMEMTNLPNPNSGIDAVTLRDGRQLLVYNHVGMIDGRWGGNRTPLNLAISQDGVDWKPVFTLEDEAGEYSYPAVIQSKDEMVHVVYTWKRQNMRHFIFNPSELVG